MKHFRAHFSKPASSHPKATAYYILQKVYISSKRFFFWWSLWGLLCTEHIIIKQGDFDFFSFFVSLLFLLTCYSKTTITVLNRSEQSAPSPVLFLVECFRSSSNQHDVDYKIIYTTFIMLKCALSVPRLAMSFIRKEC